LNSAEQCLTMITKPPSLSPLGCPGLAKSAFPGMLTSPRATGSIFFALFSPLFCPADPAPSTHNLCFAIPSQFLACVSLTCATPRPIISRLAPFVTFWTTGHCHHHLIKPVPVAVFGSNPATWDRLPSPQRSGTFKLCALNSILPRTTATTSSASQIHVPSIYLLSNSTPPRTFTSPLQATL